MSGDSTAKLKSIEKADQVIKYLQISGTAGVTDIANGLGMAKSTIHSYLSTLEDLEYVTNTGGEYSLSLKFLTYGMAAKKNRVVSQCAQPTLASYCEDFSQIVWLVVEEHGHAVFLEAYPENVGRPSYGRVGKRTLLHNHAAGKAILAGLPDQQVHAIIEEHGLPEATPNTKTDPDELETELETIRSRGFALCDNEAMLGIRGVAVPILHGDDVIGSVAVFGSQDELVGEKYTEELPNQLKSVGKKIETRLADYYGESA